MQTIHERFAGVLHSVKNNSISSKKKKTIIYLLVSLLVLSIGIGVIAGVTSRKKTDAVKLPPAAHAVLKSSCTSTLYPDLCYSSVADSVSGAAENLSSKKSVIGVALNATCTAVEHNYVSIKKLSSRKNLTKREKQAVHDCLEMVDETLDELHTTIEDLQKYPSNKSLSDHADDMRTLMSSAITNQETCLDGFSHDSADREVRAALEAGQTLVTRMCSNALAMIKNMTDEDLEKERVTAAEKKTSRKVLESGGQSWPEWISAGDRRLLQSSSVKADLVVAADGSGDYKTVAEAVAKAPEKSSKRFVIQIKSGVYRENVEVTKKKTNIMFVGDGRMKTIITGDKNVVDGTTTFKSATVAIVGGGFLARDITFQNTAGPSKHQAVALRVGADLSAFYRCDFLAYQDTLYVHSNRQFFMNCLIVGTVDFIFGNAAAVFQDCDIHARRPNSGQKNMVTAQSRADPNQNTGIVIQSSRIGATSDLQPVKASFPTYLGRPWKEYSRTVIMKTEIGDVIQAAGWHDWSGDFALATLYYGEYQNTGAGADTSKRVNWKGFKVITSAAEAEQFSAGKFIAGGNWLASSGFPFSLGL